MVLNMVRAGVVKNPSEWAHSGYGESQNERERYRLMGRKALMQLLGISDSKQLSLSHRSWIEEVLKTKEKIRERKWSESFAVGTLSFIEEVKTELRARGFRRNIIISSAQGHELRGHQVLLIMAILARKRSL
jgi:putative transposase